MNEWAVMGIWRTSLCFEACDDIFTLNHVMPLQLLMYPQEHVFKSSYAIPMELLPLVEQSMLFLITLGTYALFDLF